MKRYMFLFAVLLAGLVSCEEFGPVFTGEYENPAPYEIYTDADFDPDSFMSIADLKAKSRKRELVYPRQVAMYLAKEKTDLSLKSIGYHFGGRDHSTVIHAVQTISELVGKNAEARDMVEKLKARFK